MTIEGKHDGGNDQPTLVVNGKEVPLKTEEERKAEIEATRAVLRKQLESGEISGIEYNQKIIDLMGAVDYKIKKTAPTKVKVIIFSCLIASVICILAVVAVQLNWRFYFQNTITAKMLPDYSDELFSSEEAGPVQVKVDGFETGEYKGRPIRLDYKEYYDITATVTSVYDYWGFEDYNTLVPRDVCLAWGSLAEAYRRGQASFSQFDRSCGPDVSTEHLDTSELTTARTPFGVTGYALTTMSNNHLIPSTAEIRNRIFSLRAGDEVRIIGYLVKVNYNDIVLDSSTRRDDAANGACEVIYVTNIERKDRADGGQ